MLSRCITFCVFEQVVSYMCSLVCKFVNIQQLQLQCWLTAFLLTLYYCSSAQLWMGSKLQLDTWKAVQ